MSVSALRGEGSLIIVGQTPLATTRFYLSRHVKGDCDECF